MVVYYVQSDVDKLMEDQNVYRTKHVTPYIPSLMQAHEKEETVFYHATKQVNH